MIILSKRKKREISISEDDKVAEHFESVHDSLTMSSCILRRGRFGQLFCGLSGRTPVRREVADGSRKGLWSINATTSHAAYRRPRLAP